MRIAIASDHAGLRLKRSLVEYVQSLGHEVEDLGPATDDKVDYPDFAAKVAKKIQSSDAERGILVCGSGIGMSMAANRFRGVRALVAMNSTQAELARAHNDANVVCLGERLVGEALAQDIVKAFLARGFDGGRHQQRVEKIDSAP